MIEKFKGTGVALVTPMFENGEIDFDGLSRLIEYVIDGGVDYLVVLGTTGESPTIYPEERNEIIDFISRKNNSRKPLVIGFSGNFTAHLVNKLKSMDDLRIDGVLISSPHYSKPSQEGIVKHYQAAADACRYPVILYNVPHRTASNMEASTTLKLAEHPQIVAIKEASGNLEQCKEIILKKPKNFQVISGDDGVTLDLIKMGGYGVISVIANAYPKSMSTIVRRALNGHYEHNKALVKAIELSGKEGNPTSVKGALMAKEICEKFLRLPMTSSSNSLIEEFKSLELG